MGLKSLFTGVLISCALCFTLPTHAENSQDFGDYVVHFNALTTDILPPKVTQEYGITRSRNRAMLTVAVLRKVLGTTGQPVSAKIQVSASNLTGHKKDIKLREIREGSAIYYIGEFGVTHEENLEFNVNIKPESTGKSLRVEFQQQFYTR